MERKICEGNQPIDVNQANDAAFWAELSTVVECFDEFISVVDLRHFSQQLDSLLIESLGFLLNVLLLAEKEEVVVFFKLLSSRLILIGEGKLTSSIYEWMIVATA